MKKNRAMRLASILLVVVLMSTCTISGTFAKYVSEGTGTDTARVAKWGVTITANGKTFAEAYDNEADESGSTVVSAGYDSAVEELANEDRVVAPGTSGNMAAMTLSGAPEVDVEVKYEADLALAGWEVDGDYYCPLEIKVGDNWIFGSAAGSMANLENAVEEAIEAYTAKYEANQDLSDAAVKTPAVSWNWPFSTSDANDKKDTKLGNAANAGSPATVTLTIKTTVTQID